MKKDRESIYENMISDLFEIPIEEIDPAIKIIFKANAHQLEKIYKETEETNERVLKKLVSDLIPDNNLSIRPSFTIVKLNSKNKRLNIEPTEEFKIEGKDENGQSYKFYFTAIGHHNCPKVELKTIVAGNCYIDYNDPKEIVIKKIDGSNSNLNRTKVLWMGIDIEDTIKDNDQLSFFIGNKILDRFDYDNQLFNKAKWTIEGSDKELTTKLGIDHLFKNENLRKHEVSKLIGQRKKIYEQEIIDIFKNSFITLTELPTNFNLLKSESPSALENENFNGHFSDKKLLWLKAEFDTPLSINFIKNNPIYFNAFPLINRKLVTNQISKQNFNKILLPINTTEYFLGIESIHDDEYKRDKMVDNVYKEIDYVNFYDNETEGTYTIRQGSSIRRPDQEDIGNKINYLLDLIQEESISYKEMGTTELNENFDAIREASARIKESLPNIYKNEKKRSPYYCIVNCKENAALIYYDYWETQGDKIFKLDFQKKHKITNENGLVEESFTITPIQIVKKSVIKYGDKDSLKNTIVSRNKIVTIGDIENFCNDKYGDFIKGGLKIYKRIDRIEDKDGNSSFGKVIVVQVELKKELTGIVNKDFFRIQLQNGLNANTCFYTPIKIDIEN